MAEKVVDVHLHPFTLITDDHLLTEMDKAGVDVAVLLALDVDPTDLDRPNIIEMIQQSPLRHVFFRRKESYRRAESFS